MTNPTQGLPLQVSLTPMKVGLRADGEGDLDVLMRVQAPEQPASNRPRLPLSLALVIDRSGSMAGDKLAAAKACVLDLVKRLAPDDEVGILAYDTAVDIVMPLTAAKQAQDSAAGLLAQVDDGGSTDLHAGWLQGARQIASRTGANRLCRVILLSDGQANHGIVSTDEICEQVRQLAQAGVSTTTVGLGNGFNEALMSAMAVAGQGSALYGDRAEDLAEPFAAEFSLLANLAWRDVRLIPGSATSQWRMRNTYPGVGDGAWALPSIAAGSEAWAVFSVPMGSAARAQVRSRQGMALHVTITARNADGQLHEFKASLAPLPLLGKQAWEALPADELVVRRTVEVKAANLQRRAQAAVAKGDWTEAERLLAKTEALAVDHPWLQRMLAETRELLRQRDRERSSKELMYASMSLSRRLASAREVSAFAPDSEAELDLHLRRKSRQGRSGTV